MIRPLSPWRVMKPPRWLIHSLNFRNHCRWFSHVELGDDLQLQLRFNMLRWFSISLRILRCRNLRTWLNIIIWDILILIRLRIHLICITRRTRHLSLRIKYHRVLTIRWHSLCIKYHRVLILKCRLSHTWHTLTMLFNRGMLLPKAPFSHPRELLSWHPSNLLSLHH